ncbi:MAG TPA: hypothetical protein VGJ28_09570 [Micromonosporaceae bacterium]
MIFGKMGRIGGAALTVAAAATMLAGCGGSSAKATASTSTNKTGANGIQAYVSCLNQHGVKITLPSGAARTRPSGAPRTRPSGAPRPSFSPGAGRGAGGFGGGGFGGGIFGNANNPPSGVSQSTWSAALTACKSVQPTFNRGGFGGGGNNAAFQAYLNCLKSHGVSASAGPNSLSTSDPKTATAMKTCAPLRPTGRPSVAPSPAN